MRRTAQARGRWAPTGMPHEIRGIASTRGDRGIAAIQHDTGFVAGGAQPGEMIERRGAVGRCIERGARGRDRPRGGVIECVAQHRESAHGGSAPPCLPAVTHPPEIELRRHRKRGGHEQQPRRNSRPPSRCSANSQRSEHRRHRGDDGRDQVLYARRVQPLAGGQQRGASGNGPPGPVAFAADPASGDRLFNRSFS